MAGSGIKNIRFFCLRMPAILNEHLAYEWMFDNLDETRILEIASTQIPVEEM